jgi:hypothetical protein
MCDPKPRSPTKNGQYIHQLQRLSYQQNTDDELLTEPSNKDNCTLFCFAWYLVVIIFCGSGSVSNSVTYETKIAFWTFDQKSLDPPSTFQLISRKKYLWSNWTFFLQAELHSLIYEIMGDRNNPIGPKCQAWAGYRQAHTCTLATSPRLNSRKWTDELRPSLADPVDTLKL